jgi:D-alanyl-D-alanine carboxypeptidase/D-alanyl-D-alanine-endopeptidase (penicillin-binding protein 4)
MTRARRFPRRLTRAAALAGLLVVLSVGSGGAQETAATAAAHLRQGLGSLVQTGGVAVGENGRALFVYRPGRYVPASIVKLATALAAFHALGPDYRFRTEVYRQDDVLYLRGYGDPYLVSEEWTRMAEALAAAGQFREPLQALVLDDSAFAPGQDVDGASDSLNPYDARLGALVTNFNTVFVAVGRDGRVASAEPQTPLTPLAEQLGRALPPGEHRINLTARGVPGVRYVGELAGAVFGQAGARFREPPRSGRVPPGLSPVWVHRSSRTLREVVAGMMEFSNNFVANQVVLALALERAGEPARLADGTALVRRYLERELGLDPRQFELHEGSGLSRNNRVELTAMLAIVDAFHPYAELLKLHGRAPLQAPAKTGTLTGVYTLAGFLPAHPGERRPFVIMLNQERHTRDAVFRRLLSAFPLESPATAGHATR